MRELRAYKRRLKNESITEHKQKIRVLRNIQCKEQEQMLNNKLAENKAAMIGKGCSWKFDTSVFSTDKNVRDFIHSERMTNEGNGLISPKKGKYFKYDMAY